MGPNTFIVSCYKGNIPGYVWLYVVYCRKNDIAELEAYVLNMSLFLHKCDLIPFDTKDKKTTAHCDQIHFGRKF